MKFLYLLYKISEILFIFSTIFVTAEEIEVDYEGNIHDDIPDPIFRPVVFVNNYPSDKLVVYWYDGHELEFTHAFDMRPTESINVDTTTGHIFRAILAKDEQLPVTPTSIVIQDHVDHYYFGPHIPKQKHRGRYHASVKLIGHRTYAMSAKFRSLVHATDYYYDDGGEGTFQGTLQLGKESTTNTYEGHVFYFTESGNKSNEYARFKMSKNQVNPMVYLT